MSSILSHRFSRAVATAALIGSFAAPTVLAQRGDQYDRWDRYHNGRYDAYTRPAVIDAYTLIPVRISQPISASRADDRVFRGTIADDIWDDYGRLAVPLIPRGTPVALRVRAARGGDLILDLEAITLGHDRYAIDSQAVRVEGWEGDRDHDAAAMVGTGAVIGTIVGAIAGGGKGAAIGAATGAAAGGVGVMAQGREVRVPAGAVVTFRLDRSLAIAGSDHRH
jgi:hypothetical protein